MKRGADETRLWRIARRMPMSRSGPAFVPAGVRAHCAWLQSVGSGSVDVPDDAAAAA
jgi:hypothetical protein